VDPLRAEAAQVAARLCGLSVTDHALPVAVTVTLVGRQKIHRDRTQAQAQVPKVLGVRSGASWDEVRVRLVPG
jgi:DNA segregation ATPase FtsK/SpoIIIE, S-DNA-T family